MAVHLSVNAPNTPVQEFVRAHPGDPRRLHPLTEQALRQYPWPGNLRELRHTIERACIPPNKSESTAGSCLASRPEAPKAMRDAVRNRVVRFIAASLTSIRAS